jgi:putative aldouronate transport system permease protein
MKSGHRPTCPHRRSPYDRCFATREGSAGRLNLAAGGVTPTTGIKMAVAVLGALPVLIVYPLFQQYFVRGIAIGAVKG